MTNTPTIRHPDQLVRTALRRWKQQLIDLSRRNRLISFEHSRSLKLTHPTTKELFDGLTQEEREYTVFTEEPLLDRTESDAIRDLPAAGASPLPDPVQRRGPNDDEIDFNRAPEYVERSLHSFRIRSITAQRDHGVTVLFMAFGILEWKENDNSEESVFSPLLLVPVSLDRDTQLEPFKMVSSGDTIVNPALRVRLNRDYELRLEPPETGDDQPNLAPILDHLRKAIVGRPSWKVHESAYLDVFKFSKQALYQDLEDHENAFSKHPVVRHLAGEVTGIPEPPPNLWDADQLDEKLEPGDTFQILDADASQQEAIAAVNRGVSLAIQGPPGTGKSQTITNIIAETLGRGKTVLFVSEKMAALNVVAKRLDDAGLKEFCLEVHSQPPSGRVVHDLAAPLLEPQPLPENLMDLYLEQVSQLRQKLNDYVKALHNAENPLKLSAFQVHGELASREAAPRILFDLPDIGELSQQGQAKLLAAVKRLIQVGNVLLSEEDHPWRGCVFDEFTLGRQTALEDQLSRLVRSAEKLHEIQSVLQETWGLSEGSSLESARWLDELIRLSKAREGIRPEWLQNSTIDDLKSTVRDCSLKSEKYARQRTALLATYSVDLFGLDLEQILSVYKNGALSPASFLVPGEGSPTDRVISHEAVIKKAAVRASTALQELCTHSSRISGQLGLDEPQTVNRVADIESIVTLIATDPQSRPQWFDQSHHQELLDLSAAANHKHEDAKSLRAKLEAKYQKDFFDLDLLGMLDRFKTEYVPWHRFWSASYRRDMGQLKDCLAVTGKLNYEESLASLKNASDLLQAETWLKDHQNALRDDFGSHYEGENTDWKRVAASISTVRQICDWLGNAVPESLVTLLCSPHGSRDLKPYLTQLSAAVKEAKAALHNLGTVISMETLPFDGLLPTDAPMVELSSWLSKWLAGLEPLWEAVTAMNACRNTKSRSVSRLSAEAQHAIEVLSIDQWFKKRSEELREKLGTHYKGTNTNWESLLEALDRTELIIRHLRGPAPASYISAFTNRDDLPESVHKDFQTSLHQVARLITEFRKSFLSETTVPMKHTPLEECVSWAQHKLEALPQLADWIELNRALAAAEEIGIQAFVRGLREERPAPSSWEDIFLRQLYTLWLTWQNSQFSSLAEFRGLSHDDLIAEFRVLDKQQWQEASKRVARCAAANRPRPNRILPPLSEPGILRREDAKKKRFRPLRKLFADLPVLLPKLKPCLLMSPLDVAQHLGESSIIFDVVIFDEASQIQPADALSAIGRGKQTVIVGDQKQLPPTRFFQEDSTQSDDPGNDEELPESILDACLGIGFPQKRLLWHYRSRHEHLIAFSNREFYDGKLITFPARSINEHPIEFVYVEGGEYDRGGTAQNLVEARQIVDRIIDHVERHRDKTLGIVTFSERQMLAIDTEVSRRKRERPELEELLREDGLEGFFVKNLENVQGDERDVIFFSIGYGPDASGRMTMHFGPLNAPGGERRLNVALTRARESVKMFSSFRPQDIDVGRTEAIGPRLLRRYLEFAEQGPVALLQPTSTGTGEPESPFEAAVATSLKHQGLNVDFQVGVGPYRIDIAIKNDSTSEYLLGVECDGATYHSAKTARDRDRLRQQVLEDQGWSIHRIWSRDWIVNREGEVKKVLDALDQERSKDDKSAVSAPSEVDTPSKQVRKAVSEPSRQDFLVPHVSSDEKLGLAETYERCELPSLQETMPGNPSEFRKVSTSEFLKVTEDEWYLDILVRYVGRCVETEGPVHIDRVMRALAGSYGITKLGSLVAQRLNEIINRAETQFKLFRPGPFLWKSNSDVPTIRAANSDGEIRDVEHVSPGEIGIALVAYLQQVLSISRDSLLTGVARELGYNRTGRRVNYAIDNVVQQLIDNGTLLNLDDRLQLAELGRDEVPGHIYAELVLSETKSLAVYKNLLKQSGNDAVKFPLEDGEDPQEVRQQLEQAARETGIRIVFRKQELTNAVIFKVLAWRRR